MRIAICEDAQFEADKLQRIIRQYFREKGIEQPIINHFERGDAFLDKYKQVPPYDIIFLDIRMPGMSGLDVAKTIRAGDRHCHIVFVTHAPEFAAAGYVVNAVRYLTKPYSASDVRDTMNVILETFEEDRHFLSFEHDNIAYRIPVSHIVYMIKIDRKSEIHLLNEKIVSTYLSIKEAMELLNGAWQIFSPYRTYFLNLSFIKVIDKQTRTIHLKMEINCRFLESGPNLLWTRS